MQWHWMERWRQGEPIKWPAVSQVGTRAFRWGLLGVSGYFLVPILQGHWHRVLDLPLSHRTYGYGLGVFLLAIAAQVWAGILWHWVLRDLQQPVALPWSVATVLQNTPAKYVPGSVWHLVGRLQAALQVGLPLDVATLSVALEPPLLIAAALSLALLLPEYRLWEGSGLLLLLLGFHPTPINVLLRGLHRVRRQLPNIETGLRHYPGRPLGGALLYGLLRGLCFVCALSAFAPLSAGAIPQGIGGFGLAWLLRLVAPTPGGLGVFELSIVTVLGRQYDLPLLLGAVALYRLATVCAELLGAGLAYAAALWPWGRSAKRDSP